MRIAAQISVVLAVFWVATAAWTGAALSFEWRRDSVGRLHFDAPSGPDWSVERRQSSVEFIKAERSFLGGPKRLRYVRVIRNSFPESLDGWTEQEIADDFRDSEEMGMQLMGVQTGMYEFISLRRGEEPRSGFTLHTMKMVMRGGVRTEWALHRLELYLLFPSDFASTREFYNFLLSDFCVPKSCKTKNLSVEELKPVLDRLEVSR